MITLKIFNPDGSLYWRDNFVEMDSCLAWLEEEKTRPYWNKDFTCVVEDNRPTPEQIAQQEAQALAELNAKNQLKESAKTKLKALGLTDAEVTAIIGV